jgi:hypothetical protein
MQGDKHQLVEVGVHEKNERSEDVNCCHNTFLYIILKLQFYIWMKKKSNRKITIDIENEIMRKTLKKVCIGEEQYCHTVTGVIMPF